MSEVATARPKPTSEVPPLMTAASSRPGNTRFPVDHEPETMFSNGPAHANPTASATGAERKMTASVVPNTAQPTTPSMTVPKSPNAAPRPSSEDQPDVAMSCDGASASNQRN